jgi:hypothetical protein
VWDHGSCGVGKVPGRLALAAPGALLFLKTEGGPTRGGAKDDVGKTGDDEAQVSAGAWRKADVDIGSPVLNAHPRIRQSCPAAYKKPVVWSIASP